MLLLVVALVPLMGVWAFVELADEVVEGETEALDRAVLRSFRARDDPFDPLGPPWIEEAMRDLTALGSSAVITLVALAIAGYLALARRWRALGPLVVLVGGGAVLARLLKEVFARPRPSVVPHLQGVESASFPSSHAMMAAVVYLSLGVVLARLVDETRVRVFIVGVALLIALLVGLSRVYAGVHYPSDVLAGWVLGLTLGGPLRFGSAPDARRQPPLSPRQLQPRVAALELAPDLAQGTLLKLPDPLAG